MSHYTKTITALIEKCGHPDPTIAELAGLALNLLDITRNDSAAAIVLNSILGHDDLVKAIDSRLNPMTLEQILATHPSQTHYARNPQTGRVEPLPHRFVEAH